MSPAENDRKIQSGSGNNVLPDNGRLGAGAFAAAIAAALHSEYGGTRAAVKTIVALTAANERAVRNWLDGRNGPSGELLVALCRHSDAVLETVLLLAGRNDLLTAKKLTDAKSKLREMLAMIDNWDE